MPQEELLLPTSDRPISLKNSPLCIACSFCWFPRGSWHKCQVNTAAVGWVCVLLRPQPPTPATASSRLTHAPLPAPPMPDPRWRKCLKCCVVKSLDDFPPNFFICASCDAASPAHGVA